MNAIRERNRQLILDSAAAEFAEKGFTGKDQPDARDFDAAAETITRLVVQGTAPVGGFI